MARAYISIGSNIEPERNLRIALLALRQRFGTLEASPTYRSAAVGFDGPAFLNNIVAFDCDLDIDGLRNWLHATEDANGRDRRQPHYSNRTLDLDLALWCEGDSCVTDCTREEFERAHVLAPLADVVPARRDPFTGTPILERWRQLAPGLPRLERVALDPGG